MTTPSEIVDSESNLDRQALREQLEARGLWLEADLFFRRQRDLYLRQQWAHAHAELKAWRDVEVEFLCRAPQGAAGLDSGGDEGEDLGTSKPAGGEAGTTAQGRAEKRSKPAAKKRTKSEGTGGGKRRAATGGRTKSDEKRRKSGQSPRAAPPVEQDDTEFPAEGRADMSRLDELEWAFDRQYEQVRKADCPTPGCYSWWQQSQANPKQFRETVLKMLEKQSKSDPASVGGASAASRKRDLKILEHLRRFREQQEQPA